VDAATVWRGKNAETDEMEAMAVRATKKRRERCNITSAKIENYILMPVESQYIDD